MKECVRAGHRESERESGKPVGYRVNTERYKLRVH